MVSEPSGQRDVVGAPVPGSVSVLMPVRNEAASIEGAVQAALAQTHLPDQVLVIDGRSTDGTQDRVRSIAAGDSRVRVLDNPAGGISAGLNVGLAQARTEFVARMDGHATVNREYVELGVRRLRENPEVAGVGGRRIGVARTSTGRAIALALSSPFGVGDSINHYGREVQHTDHASFGVYRTRAAVEVRGWDEDLLVNEDVDFDLRLLRAGHRILYEPAMLINWNVRETLADLARQYRRYGRGKGAMVAKNGPTALRARHLAAPGLVSTLAGSAALVATGRRRSGLALAAPYAAAVVAATALTLRTVDDPSLRAGVRSAPALAGAFVAMHTSWGVGFFEGLAGRRPAASSQRLPSRPPR